MFKDLHEAKAMLDKIEKWLYEEAKPSAGLSKKQKSSIVKKAKHGGDIGKKGKGFEKVAQAAKKGGARDPEAVAAAAMWKNVKREGMHEEEEEGGLVNRPKYRHDTETHVYEEFPLLRRMVTREEEEEEEEEEVLDEEKEKLSKVDYDKDGKLETPTQEWKGSRDKAIKKAMGKEKVKESADPEVLEWLERFSKLK